LSLSSPEPRQLLEPANLLEPLDLTERELDFTDRLTRPKQEESSGLCPQNFEIQNKKPNPPKRRKSFFLAGLWLRAGMHI
jgi:hypothetical protein